MSSSKEQFILDAYFNQCKSTLWISEQLGVSPKTVRNIIVKSGNALRDKKSAAKASYKNGRKPPMEGKTHSEKTKRKIAKGVFINWKELSEENYEKRVENRREKWYNLDVLVRENIIYKARTALSKVARDGSKLERSVTEFLIKHKFSPVTHYDKFPHEKLEVDIFLPANKIAIEIDGPSHSLPIYGEERLQATIKSDEKKNGLLLSLGYVVIRIIFLGDTCKHTTNVMLDQLLQTIQEITLNFPEPQKRYIELEME